MSSAQVLAVGCVESLAEDIVCGGDSHLRLRGRSRCDGKVGAVKLIAIDIRHGPVKLGGVGITFSPPLRVLGFANCGSCR